MAFDATLALLTITCSSGLVFWGSAFAQTCGLGSGHADLHFKGNGAASELLEERIVGGVSAQPHEWPWQVSLRLTNPQTGQVQHWCGGTLIGRQHVITAAHCVKNSFHSTPQPSAWKVRLGDHYLQSPDASELTVSVLSINHHPSYNQFDNDVAVMRLSRPVEFSSTVQPICLPQTSMDFTNMKCVATGWGKQDGGSSSMSNALQEVSLQIFDNSACNEPYQRQFQISIQQWHLCAGTQYQKKGTCQGDSGGPLQCKHKGQWYVVGVTSFGSGCAKPGFPDVFARVSHFSSWIRTQALLL